MSLPVALVVGGAGVAVVARLTNRRGIEAGQVDAAGPDGGLAEAGVVAEADGELTEFAWIAFHRVGVGVGHTRRDGIEGGRRDIRALRSMDCPDVDAGLHRARAADERSDARGSDAASDGRSEQVRARLHGRASVFRFFIGLPCSYCREPQPSSPLLTASSSQVMPTPTLSARGAEGARRGSAFSMSCDTVGSEVLSFGAITRTAGAQSPVIHRALPPSKPGGYSAQHAHAA